MSFEKETELCAKLESAEPSPYEAVAREFSAKALREALSNLSFEHREAIWMCYFEEKSLQDIAKTVGCPENTIKTRLFHARRLLRSSGLQFELH
jgi:RNA polymerase sigma-70 factor, ECF subfamily